MSKLNKEIKAMQIVKIEDDRIKVSRADWLLWKEDKVTQRLLQELQLNIEILEQKILHAGSIRGVDALAILGQSHGEKLAYQNILNFEIEDEEVTVDV